MSDSDSDIPAPPPRKPSVEIPALKTRIVELETEVSTLKSQLATYQQDNAKYLAEIDALKKQIAALTQEKEQLNQELKTTTQQEAKGTSITTPGTIPSTSSTASIGKNDKTTAVTDLEIMGLKSEIETLKDQIRRQELLLLETSGAANKPLVVSSVGTSINRKPGQVTLKMRKNRQEKVLAVRTQITAWLNRILSPEPLLTPENLMERLATGVIICDLAIFVSETAIPILGRVHVKAQPYSILAHENVQSFLKVCYEWGLRKIECFTTQDLLSSNPASRNERLVVETLLSLSRVVYLKFGIDPPMIVKAEMEIDAADNNTAGQNADGTDSQDVAATKAMMAEAEHLKLLEAVKAYCALHGIVDIPMATENKGQFEFSDGTRSHIRMFELDTDRADGEQDRDAESVLGAVQAGEIVLLARHNNNWEELHKFLHDHSGGKKIDSNVVQHGAIKGSAAHTAQVGAGSLTAVSGATKAQEAKVEEVVPEKPQVIDIMADTYGAENYEEEDEDDGDEDEEYLEQQRLYEEQLRQIEEDKKRREEEAKRAREEAERTRLAKLAAEQAENELAARQKALLAQQQEEEEFRRQKQANKYKQSYLTDADLTGDMGEVIAKVRSRMTGDEDFDPQDETKFDPEKANLSHIINTSDYKRFKDVTMSEIQVMTNEDLERLAEYSSKQEFFYLTALAVKMTHELTVSSSFTAISNQELWRRAIEAQIPFHKFHRFVYDEITKSYLEQQTQERQQTGKEGANLRNRREMMLANVKERQKQKQGKHYD